MHSFDDADKQTLWGLLGEEDLNPPPAPSPTPPSEIFQPQSQEYPLFPQLTDTLPAVTESPPLVHHQIIMTQSTTSNMSPGNIYAAQNQLPLNLLNQSCVKSEADQSQYHLQQPLFVLSINPWPGSLNFEASVRPLVNSKTKWCVSSATKKLYVGKDIAFPIRVSVSQWIDAEVVICPVFANTQHRMRAVDRCPNCASKDPNQEIRKHIVQVEGSNQYYFQQDERCMVAVPLGAPAPGEDCVTFFVKLGCRTSCVGGPNRNVFSLILTLLRNNIEVGRQVIPMKVCESADRDMKNEDKNFMAQLKAAQVEPDTRIKIEKISTNLIIPKGKKRKIESPHVDYDMLKVPKKHVKLVKKYLNFLQYNDHMKNNSSEDSES